MARGTHGPSVRLARPRGEAADKPVLPGVCGWPLPPASQSSRWPVPPWYAGLVLGWQSAARGRPLASNSRGEPQGASSIQRRGGGRRSLGLDPGGDAGHPGTPEALYPKPIVTPCVSSPVGLLTHTAGASFCVAPWPAPCRSAQASPPRLGGGTDLPGSMRPSARSGGHSERPLPQRGKNHSRHVRASWCIRRGRRTVGHAKSGPIPGSQPGGALNTCLMTVPKVSHYPFGGLRRMGRYAWSSSEGAPAPSAPRRRAGEPYARSVTAPVCPWERIRSSRPHPRPALRGRGRDTLRVAARTTRGQGSGMTGRAPRFARLPPAAGLSRKVVSP